MAKNSNADHHGNTHPALGSAERGHPDFFRFVPISPFSSDLFRFAVLVFGNALICSDLFRFLPICSDLFSEQIRTNQGNPFLPTPFANPRENHNSRSNSRSDSRN